MHPCKEFCGSMATTVEMYTSPIFNIRMICYMNTETCLLKIFEAGSV